MMAARMQGAEVSEDGGRELWRFWIFGRFFAAKKSVPE
jgi:hypothetical protein